MRKALLAIIAVLAVAVAAVLGYAATLPDNFRIERAATISAPPEKVYAILSDFHRSTEWSPFEKMDPDMKRTYSGAERGKGAVYSWDGNSDAGAGRLEIVEATEPSKLVMTLDFIRPMEGRNIVEYRMEPRGDATEVTWSMHGEAPFISRVMCVFFDMDRMIGGEFEKGLANLKTLAETDKTADLHKRHQAQKEPFQ